MCRTGDGQVCGIAILCKNKMQRGLRALKNWKLWDGMENYGEDNAISEGRVYAGKNARFVRRVITSKSGYQAMGDTLVGGTKTRGMWEYPYFNGLTVQKKLIRFYNQDFWEFNPTTLTWDLIAGTWPNIEDKYVDGVVYGGSLFLVGQTNRTGNGVGKIFSGYDFTFTVAGVGVSPALNSVYQQGGSQFVVTEVTLVAGAGTIKAKRILETPDPTAAGVLTKFDALYTGDAALNYTGFVKSASPVTTFSVIANSPEGVAIEAFAERLCVIGDPSYPGSVIYSQPPADLNEFYKVENWDTATGALTFLAAKNTFLTALRAVNSSLYVWNNSAIFEHTAANLAAGINPTELSRTAGAINQKSVVVVENDVWFFNDQNQVRSLGNEQELGESPRTKAISEVILKTMSLLAPIQDNPVMSYHNRILKLALKTKDSPANNIILVFDYNVEGFSVDYGQAVDCYCIWDGSRYYGEDSSANIFKDDTGFTANGAGFPFAVDLEFEDNGRPDLFKRARYIYIRGKQSYYQTLYVRLYRGNYSTYSTYTIPSPFARGVSIDAGENDGAWGSAESGSAVFGGEAGDEPGEDIMMYRFEQLISVEQRSNLFAIGLLADINGGKIQVDQIVLKGIDEQENYKPSDR